MKFQLFTLLAVAVAAMALPQAPPTSADPTDVATDAPVATETFPTVVSGSGTVSLPTVPNDLPSTTGTASDVTVPTTLATSAAGNSTIASSSTSRPTSLSASTSRPVASTSTFSTATGGAYSVRAASVPLAVVAGILGASQMF